MSRQEIKDRDGYTTLGYIENMPDGRQKALAKDGYTTLGHYDPQRNVTQRRIYNARAGQCISRLDLPKALAKSVSVGKKPATH